MLGQVQEYNFNKNMKYTKEIIKAMSMLASNPKTIFIGHQLLTLCMIFV